MGMGTRIKLEASFDPAQYSPWKPYAADTPLNFGGANSHPLPQGIGQCASSYVTAGKKSPTGHARPTLPILDETDFTKKTLQSKIPVIVLLSASWCKPCPVAKEGLLQISKSLGGNILIYAMDYDALSEEFKKKWNNKNTLPLAMFFKDGVMQDSLAGGPPITPEEEKNPQINPEKIQKYAGRLLEIISSKFGISTSQQRPVSK